MKLDDQNFTIHSGSRDGTVVRALVFYQCGLVSILAQCHMWAEFSLIMFGSRLASRVFLGILWFSSLHKNQLFKFQLNQDREPPGKPAKPDVASPQSIVVLSYVTAKCSNIARFHTVRVWV